MQGCARSGGAIRDHDCAGELAPLFTLLKSPSCFHPLANPLLGGSAAESRGAMSVDEVLGENLADSLTAFAALAAAVVSLIATSYWDSGTTIELRSVSVLLSIALTSIPSGGWITFHWFRRRPRLVAPPQWNLKHDSPGVWALTGIAAGVAL